MNSPSKPAETWPTASILLVDDRPSNLLALEAALEPMGHRLVRASSGEEALQLLLGEQGGAFALLVLDLLMPGMDGLEVATQVRAQEQTHALPILFLTSAFDQDSRAYTVGAADVLHKPFDPEVLRAKVAVFVELYQMREQLRHRGEARHAAVLAAALDSIIVMDHRGRVTDFNPAAERTFGYRREEVLGREMAELIIPPKLREAHRRGLAHYLATGEGPVLDRRIEMEAMRADGSIFPIELAISRIATPGLPAFTGYVRDISERRAAERERAALLEGERRATGALRASEARLATILRSIGDAVIATDGEGRITFMNPVAEALTRWTLPEARGLPLDQVFRILNEETRVEVPSPVGRVLREGLVVGLANHTVLLARDGSETNIADSGAPIRDEAGELVGVVLVFRDVTAEHQARQRERFLAEAGELLSNSLDYTATLGTLTRLAVPRLADGCVVHMLDAQGRLQPLQLAHAKPTDVESGAAEAVGSGRGVLRAGPPATMHVPIRARKRVLGAISFVAKAAQRYAPADLGFAEELARRAGIAIDNARLYREAQQANQLKDEFLSTVSHELRTPLTSILGWSQVLRTGQAENARALETIERNARVQARIVSDILDVSRVITGKLSLNLRPVDPSQAIRAAIDVVQPAADAKGLLLEARLRPDCCPIIGDADRLQQVVWNLLSNAIKFTPRGGRVEVELIGQGAVARLQVRDTGQGITPEFMPHLFERFRQADSTTTRATGGLGLGLAISRHLVELHGGRISAASDGVGKGATFTVTLPLAAQAQRERAPGEPGQVAPASAARQLDGVRVLAVEDDPDTREMLALLLEAQGARVTSAGSVGEALEFVATARPDVVLSDISMPGQDGFSLIRALHGPEAPEPPPAIALTAHAGTEDRDRILTAGFQEHLVKPVEPAELVAAVARAARSLPMQPAASPG